MTGAQLADRLRRVFLDTGPTPVYSDAVLLDALNDGSVSILSLKPTAGATEHLMTLEEGTYQELPAGDIYLHDIPFHVDGGRRHTPLRRVDRSQMDYFTPGWTTEPATTELEHWMYDESDPRHFYVYPPAQAGVTLSLLVTRLPEPMQGLTEEVPLGDQYMEAYLYYAAYRILDADSDEPGAHERSQSYYARFAEALGVRLQNRMTYTPNVRQP